MAVWKLYCCSAVQCSLAIFELERHVRIFSYPPYSYYAAASPPPPRTPLLFCRLLHTRTQSTVPSCGCSHGALPLARLQSPGTAVMTDHVSSRKRGRDTTGGVTPATSNTVRTAGLILRESGGSSGSSDTSKRYDSSSGSSGGSSSSSSACLRKGMVILRGFLSAQEQTDLAVRF